MIKYKNQPNKQGSKWIVTIVNTFKDVQKVYSKIDSYDVKIVEERINNEIDDIYNKAKSEAANDMMIPASKIPDRTSDMNFSLFTNGEKLHEWLVDNLADKQFNSAIDEMNKKKYKEVLGTTIMDTDGIYNDKNGRRIKNK